MTEHHCTCKIDEPRCQVITPEGYTCLRTRVEHAEGMEQHAFES